MSRKEIKALREMWQFRSDERGLHGIALLDELEAQDQEIARHHQDFARWEEMAANGHARAAAAEAKLEAQDRLIEQLGDAFTKAARDGLSKTEVDDVLAALSTWKDRQ